MTGANGQPVRLFDLTKGPHGTLLGYHAGTTTPALRRGLQIHRLGEGGDLLDAQHHLRDAYGLLGGEWVLLRPDGYVGAIVSDDRLDALEAYLDTVGLGA